jgi:transcriptional regulator with XRE-family HTH domain
MEEIVLGIEVEETESTNEEAGSEAMLGVRITRLRRARHWSRSMLARKLGVSRERVAKWERGENTPPLKVLLGLRSLMGLSLDELVTGEPAMEVGWSVGEWDELARVLVGLMALLRRLGILEDDEEEDWR